VICIHAPLFALGLGKHGYKVTTRP